MSYHADFCNTKESPQSQLPLFPDAKEYMKYGGRQGKGWFRPMTVDEVRQLGYGHRVWMLSTHGDARMVEINGAVKLWKRSPERLLVSVKYGLYEYAQFDEKDVEGGRFLVEVNNG